MSNLNRVGGSYLPVSADGALRTLAAADRERVRQLRTLGSPVDRQMQLDQDLRMESITASEYRSGVRRLRDDVLLGQGYDDGT